MTDQFNLQFRPAVPKGGDAPKIDALSTAQPPAPEPGRDINRRRGRKPPAEEHVRRRAIIETIVMLESLPRDDQQFIVGLFR